MTSATVSTASSPSRLADVGLFLVLAPLVLRATTQVTTFPYWDMDPLITPGFMVGLGPAGSMLLDAIAMLGAAVLVWSCAGMATRLWAVLAGLAVLGCVPIVWHIAYDTMGVGGQARIGCAWASGMLGAVALNLAARDARLRLIAAAVVLPLVLMFLARGIVQVAIEHAQTVASFKANRESTFASYGWTAESSMAKGYVRRLEQNEASGWFGLANVFASFMAAGVAGFVAASLLAKVRALRVVFGLAATLCLVGIVLADAKGGYVAAALGVVLAVGVWGTPKFLTWGWPWVGPVLVAGAVALIGVRGLIGERLSEPSILFRSFYVKAATTIAGEHPGVGVGPDGFKDAYLLAKNPLSPEEVASPHSILFDWIACLGVFGAAWGAVLIAWLWCAGRGVWREQRGSAPAPGAAIEPDERRPTLYAAALTLILPTVVAAWLEVGAVGPEQAAARLIGVMVAVAAAGAMVWRGAVVGGGGRGWSLMLVPAAITMGVHAQIEVTGSWQQSVGLVLALVAMASVGGGPAPAAVHGRWHRAAPRVVGGGLVAGAIAIGVWCVLPAFRWQRWLAIAAERVEPVARIRSDLGSPDPHESVSEQAKRHEDALTELAVLTERAKPTTAAEVQRAMTSLESKRMAAAAAYLRRAEHAWPSAEFLPRREAARLEIRNAEIASTNAPEFVPLFLDSAMASTELGPNPTAARCSWRATIAYSAWMIAKREADIREALAAARLAEKLDPYSLQQAMAVLRILRLIDIEASSVPPAAVRVLELDDLARLDREVRGLTREQRVEVERLAEPLRRGK